MRRCRQGGDAKAAKKNLFHAWFSTAAATMASEDDPKPTWDSATYNRVRSGIDYPPALWDTIWGAQPGRELALDAGCGTGLVTARVAAAGFARVVGVDTSDAQLAVAPRLEQVEYRVAPADRTGLADGSVDLITVGAALHWWVCSVLQCLCCANRRSTLDAHARCWASAPASPLSPLPRTLLASAPASPRTRTPLPPPATNASPARFDVHAFYAEARRVLKPGGALAAFTHGMAKLVQHPQAEEAHDRWQDAHIKMYIHAHLRRLLIDEDGYKGERVVWLLAYLLADGRGRKQG